MRKYIFISFTNNSCKEMEMAKNKKEASTTAIIKPKHNKTSILWLIAVAFIAVGLLLFCQFYFGDTVSSKTTYYNNTHINGVNVSGMTREEANNVILNNLTNNKDKINITLKNGDKEWTIKGEELSIVGNIQPTLDEVIEYGREGNIFNKKKVENQINENGLYVNVPFDDMFGGIENKVDTVVADIENKHKKHEIIFNPESEVMFMLNEGNKGYVVDRDSLYKQISGAVNSGENTVIEIPVQEIIPQNTLEEFISQISLRAKFSTDYSKSTTDRKNNVCLALSKFNGMIVEPNQEISFNQTTGARTIENGYKNAKIIIGGKYVSGVGGGVCQASTTLYNALIRADIEILQVNHHTLPATYVPLSFDAMVSEGYADLKFKNNFDTPIFIKTYCNDSNATVEIYGAPFEDGLEIQTRAELVKIIAHGGDDIITDTKGEYEDKVLYKGEYYRLKYPQEGYETKGYVQYVKNGEIIEEKQIRHDHYPSQNGIIVQGDSTLEDGMTLPDNSVKYIGPQKITKDVTERAKVR